MCPHVYFIWNRVNIYWYGKTSVKYKFNHNTIFLFVYFVHIIYIFLLLIHMSVPDEGVVRTQLCFYHFDCILRSCVWSNMIFELEVIYISCKPCSRKNWKTVNINSPTTSLSNRDCSLARSWANIVTFQSFDYECSERRLF
jgi:hypothetical protein